MFLFQPPPSIYPLTGGGAGWEGGDKKTVTDLSQARHRKVDILDN